METSDTSAAPAAASWSDNAVIGSLEQMSRAIDTFTATVPRELTSAGDGAGEAVPLQNLLAHLVFARHWEANRDQFTPRFRTRACPICRGLDRFTWFASQDGYRYDVCATCGMVHIPDVLPLPVWDEYYALLPTARECLQQQLLRSTGESALQGDRARFGRYITLLRSLGAAPAGARVLDLGSFTGGFLHVAAEHGLEAAGVEGLAEAVLFAHEHFPALRLVHAQTERLDPGMFSTQFDVVTMWETLEHTLDPVESLRLARRALRPGGTIAVSVPNARNVQFSALGPFCFYAYGGYQGTGHINMFSPDTLRRALAGAGFTVRHMSTEYGTDWRQVLRYLRQQFDTIHCYRNMVRRGDITPNDGADVTTLLNWLSPALTRLENVCLAGPILIAVAQA